MVNRLLYYQQNNQRGRSDRRPQSQRADMPINISAIEVDSKDDSCALDYVYYKGKG